MKAKISIAKTKEGKSFVPRGVEGARTQLVNAVQLIMAAYGVSKFDVGYTPFGGVVMYNPSVEAIKDHELKRPDVLDIILPETFKNLAPILFTHGVMRIELDEFTDEDILGIKKTWNQV
jgi:hypothetical protein